MRKKTLCIIVVLASLVYGQTNVYVYEADEVTPFDYRNIMAENRINAKDKRQNKNDF